MNRTAQAFGSWWACLGVLLTGTLVRVHQLSQPLAGDHAFRQTQTAFAIRGYAEHGVNLLHSPLPVFGTATDVPMEFPLFQALGRSLMLLGPDSSTAGRAAGLISFQAAAVLWWLILRRWRGSGLATTTLFMMEALPYGLHWGAACMIDFFSVALGLAAVLGLDVYLRSTTSARWILGAGTAAAVWLLFLVKITSVPATGVLALVTVSLAIRELGWRALWRRAAWLAVLGPGVGLVALTIWTHHADRIKNHYAATQFLTSRNLQEWNFGGTRTDVHSWTSILDWTSGSIAGPAAATLAVGLLLGLLLGDVRTRTLTLGLAASILVPILIFFNLFVVHSYYQMAIYPFVVALGAVGVVITWEQLTRKSTFLAIVPLALVVGWFASTSASAVGKNDVRQFADDWPVPAQVAEVAAVTPPATRLVTVGCDWDPQYFYFAHRTGLMIRTGTREQVDRIWSQNDLSQYGYLLRCNPEAQIADYLPIGAVVTATPAPDVFRVGGSQR